MHSLEYSSQFKKDFKKVKRMPISEIIEIGNIISILQRGEILDPKHVDHPLTGNWSGFRDCHIKPDLVLIYRISDRQLELARIGSHSEIF